MGTVACPEDLTLGPAALGCRGGFDFTLAFEETVLSIIPSSLFIVLSTSRIWSLFLAESSARGWRLRTAKLICAALYSGLQLSILVAGTQQGIRTQLSTAARSMAFISSAFILPLSMLEDRRSARPSFLLTIYLFLTMLFDVVQTRTQWLVIADIGENSLLSKLYTSAVGVKLVLLMLESQSKTEIQHYSPDEKAGPFNLATYAWLNHLFMKGYNKVLSLEDLPRLDHSISSDYLNDELRLRYPTTGATQRESRFSLAKALARTLLGPLLLGVLPRLALAGFRFCQPFLIGSLLDHIGNSLDGNAAWKNAGYGFIGASVFIYFGVAVSTALYWYCHERFICMTRGALVSAIYQKLTQLKMVDVSDSAAVTLMSTDIERIRVGLLNLHEFWGSALEVGLACWLLYRQLGVAFIAPLVVVMCSVACSSILNRYTGPRQKLWMEHIQTRVAETAHMLSNLKQLKISGLAQPAEDSTQQLRVDELKAASKFRTLYVSNMAFGYAPMALCPVITFAITARDLDTSTIFTSMAYMVLLADPLGVLFGEIPYLLTAFTCLGRIQEFLSKDAQPDGRRFTSLSAPSGDIERKSTEVNGPSLSFENGNLGWVENRPALHSAKIRLPATGLTMVIGPVGSGKSTLCKAFLAEIPFTDAVINISTTASNFRSAFCDQTPFIYNSSIRENIIGFSAFDSTRYRAVIDATLLDPDLRSLAQGDNTIVGSNGITLSGGQKQRVAMARALYREANFYVFDDPMSGLDTDTQHKVFSRVFGPDGILRQQRATVLLATHNTSYLPMADHIVVLGSDNMVKYEGNLAGLVTKGAQGHNGQQFEPLIDVKDVSPSPAETDTEVWEISDGETAALPADLSPQVPNGHSSFLSEKDRMTGDSTVYRYYLASLGNLSIVAFVVFGLGWGFFYNFGYIWLRFWSGDSNQDHSRAFYLGLYALWQAGGLASIVLCYWTSYTLMVRISGSRLHQSALQTIVRAPLSFLTSTDIGVITSLFSQDMTLVDNELPVAITNLALDVCNALGMAAVIATSSPYLVISYPILIAILYGVQKFYLRTSRQLRLLDLEAKSPLYTQFLDTARGLATIRSFGWAEDSIRATIKLLDESQKPTYLLAMVQRWLLFVLQCVVAVVAVVVVTLATQVHSNTATFTGASLVALMTFGDVLNFIIRWWTQLETSIGAVTRLKSLSDKVPSESDLDDTEPVRPEWPMCGNVQIQDISASYYSSNLETVSEGSEPSEREKSPFLVLKNFTLSVGPGEKVAVCGRTGSGKSSLVLLLLRMLDPLPSCSSGIIIDGIGLHSVPRADVRDRIIAMSQDPVFLPGDVSIKRQLDASCRSTNNECQEVLQLVGLAALARDAQDTEKDLRPDSLSAGQKQLFNLARAVLRRRARSRQLVSRSQDGGSNNAGGILLLDEVSASVDRKTADLQLRIIMDEFKNDTIIMVTHHLDMIMGFDTVIVMEHGEVVECGNPNMLAAESGSQFNRLWMAGRGGTD